jgi:hypothetical protein
MIGQISGVWTVEQNSAEVDYCRDVCDVCRTIRDGSASHSLPCVSLGSGQFRPAVVIPAVFASIRSCRRGLVAAVGTLIADPIAHGQIYVRSLVSAVPGNFVGFYIFGWLMKTGFNWANYVKVS